VPPRRGVEETDHFFRRIEKINSYGGWKMQKHMTARIATAAMIAMAAAATTAQAQELLLNGGFEAGAINDPGAPDWTTFNFTFTSGEYARTEGGKSFKAYGPFFGVGQGSVGLQSTPVTPGTNLTLTGYMFSPTTDHINGANIGILELHYLDASNAVIPGSGQQAQLTASSPADVWNPFSVTAVAPANAARAEVVIGHIQLNTPVTGGAVFLDDLSLQAAVVTESVWISTGSGGWLSGSNWQGSTVPNSVGATANFGSSITAPATVTIAGAGATAGTVKFNNALAYTVDGPGALTLDVASGGAALTVTAGSHAINAPLIINDTTTSTVAAGQTLSIGGALTLNNGAHLTAAGAGTTRINATSVTGSAGATASTNGGILQADVDLGSNVDVLAFAGEARFNATQHLRSVTIAANAKVSVPDTASTHVLRTSSLTLDAAGTLELGDNAAVLDYTAGNSPAAAVRAAIILGRTGGGKGIVASKTATDSRTAIGYFDTSVVGPVPPILGEAVDLTTVVIRVTLKGDATLNGTVGFEDLVQLAQSYNLSGRVWSDGDFDYDGDVDFADLIPLAQYYNLSLSADDAAALGGADFAADWALAQSLAPEPTTLAASLAATTLLLRRRRGAVA
jgi:hypothetical protein